MKRILGIAAMISLGAAALLPLTASAAGDHRDGWYPAYQTGYDDGYAPPPPRYERTPRPQHGFIWQPGHWVWQHGRYEWANGKWMRERNGFVYVPTAWVERDGRYFLREARWERDRRWERGYEDRYAQRRVIHDRDRDRVPDRYDRDLDNDGVANRYDRDMDGDGVRNERDRDPDNRYRY